MQVWEWIKEQKLITKLNIIVLILSIGFLLFGIIADRKDIVDYVFMLLGTLAVYFIIVLTIYWIKVDAVESANYKRDGYQSSYWAEFIALIIQILSSFFF